MTKSGETPTSRERSDIAGCGAWSITHPVAPSPPPPPPAAATSNSPGEAVFGGQKAIGIGTAGSAVGSSPARFVIDDGHPFMAWGQRTAVLKQARNCTAAKLFLNWQLSTQMQNGSFNGWSVRTDATPPAGLKPIWEYPNAHLDGFPPAPVPLVRQSWPPSPPTLAEAVKVASTKAFVILDGTLLPIDRIAVIADPHGRLLWASPSRAARSSP